jgi:hypothetical protein
LCRVQDIPGEYFPEWLAHPSLFKGGHHKPSLGVLVDALETSQPFHPFGFAVQTSIFSIGKVQLFALYRPGSGRSVTYEHSRNKAGKVAPFLLFLS